MTIGIQDKSKNAIRVFLKEKRSSLSSERKAAARAALTFALLPLLKSYRSVLSFCSLPEEIDLTLINLQLVQEGKLCLPKVKENDTLQIYKVNNFEKDLLKSKWKLCEPDPSKCQLIDLKNIDCILVPGLGFDKHDRRIGFGKGHYDRLLKLFIEHSLFPKKIGVGFKEQFCKEDLPYEMHDIELDEVRLF